MRGTDHRRATGASARLESQKRKLNLPLLPTTTLGSFPQTLKLRKIRREYKANKLVVLRKFYVLRICNDLNEWKLKCFKCHNCRISEEEYVKAITEEINEVVKLQEELDIDVLVHGEPEVMNFFDRVLLFLSKDTKEMQNS